MEIPSCRVSKGLPEIAGGGHFGKSFEPRVSTPETEDKGILSGGSQGSAATKSAEGRPTARGRRLQPSLRFPLVDRTARETAPSSPDGVPGKAWCLN